MLRLFRVSLLTISLSACGTAAPLSPVTANLNEEFILTPGQTALIAGTDLTIALTGVGDARCPLDIECAESGPVTVVIEVAANTDAPMIVTLQAFTDTDGRVPAGPFEGIQDRAEHEGYLIQLKSVLPFPQMSTDEIDDKDYRVSFAVSK